MLKQKCIEQIFFRTEIAYNRIFSKQKLRTTESFKQKLRTTEYFWVITVTVQKFMQNIIRINRKLHHAKIF